MYHETSRPTTYARLVLEGTPRGIAAYEERRAALEISGADYPRPLLRYGEPEVRAHLASLGTGAAPGPSLAPRSGPARMVLALLAAALLLALVTIPASAATGGGYVMYTNDRTMEIVSVLVLDHRSTSAARAAYDELDARGIEDAFEVRVGDEHTLTRSQARAAGVDEMRSFYVTDRPAVGMVNVLRQGSTVAIILYIAYDEPDFDLGFAFTDRVIEDGLDARKPYGFTEYAREGDDAPVSRSGSI